MERGVRRGRGVGCDRYRLRGHRAGRPVAFVATALLVLAVIPVALRPGSADATGRVAAMVAVSGAWCGGFWIAIGPFPAE